MRRRPSDRRPGTARRTAGVLAGVVLAGLAGWHFAAEAPPRPLSPATLAATVASAGALAAEYVEAAWCRPMLAGTVGTVPRWPRRLATAAAAPGLVAGPPRGVLTAPDPPGLVDVSDVRAVLPPSGQSWTVRPRFCVFDSMYPRVVTSGGRSHPVDPPLPRRLRSLQQVFARFPAYLGRVTAVAVPVTIEVAYSLSVDGSTPRDFHLAWVTTLGLVPRRSGQGLRLSTWALGTHGAFVTVRHDAPLGPAVVQPRPPDSGP